MSHDEQQQDASAKLQQELLRAAKALFIEGLIKWPSIKSMCRHCGIDDSTVYYALRQGRMTDKLAHRIVTKAGLDSNGTPRISFRVLMGEQEEQT